uniref:Uncharacterized protein n=1 Tax=Anguilla anguilla TaxID=7936 RepID=A0A0E9W454_ANGAN
MYVFFKIFLFLVCSVAIKMYICEYWIIFESIANGENQSALRVIIEFYVRRGIADTNQHLRLRKKF